ncbi:MAG: carbohydrate kinase family protein [Candidatus Syntropharchaeales archaeon]
MDVIGLGALNYDRLYRVERIAAPGEEIGIIDLVESSGGSAANTIVGLSRLGLACGFIGGVGEDVEGEKILSDLRRDHVDITQIKRVPSKRSGTVIGFIDRRGERTLYVDAGANDDLTIEDIDIEYLRRARLIHTSSFVDKSQLKMQIELVKLLKRDVVVSFSPGMLCFKYGFDDLKGLIEDATIIFLNEDELSSLTGLELEDACDLLQGVGHGIIAVTRGKAGSHIAAGDMRINVPAEEIPDHEVLDTTGAGDAYAAGFIYGYLREERPERCGVIGSKVASHCIRGVGARFLPKEKDIIKIK